MNTDIVVIIPCRNEAARLPRQLAALNEQTDLGFRVLVSDNGSTDATALIARNWNATFAGGIRAVDSSALPGAAHARNAAIRACDEPLILCCDSDDVVQPGWVAAMRRGLASHDVVTGPLHLIFPGAPRRNKVWNAEVVPTSMGYRAYAPSGNIGLRRMVFDALNGFDESLSIGQEDVDFGWRAIGQGFRIGHDENAALDYYQRSNFRALVRQQLQYGKAHVILYDKHRDATDIPSPASNKASVRWFWEWAKQFPGKVSSGRGQDALAAVVFQASRFYHSLRIGRSPL